MIRIALFLSVLPGIVMAQSFDGTYQLDGCGPETTETRIVVAGNRITYLESFCTLTNPVSVRDMSGATLFDAICQGEGTTWSYRAFLMPSADGGLISIREGYAFSYMRCE